MTMLVMVVTMMMMYEDGGGDNDDDDDDDGDLMMMMMIVVGIMMLMLMCGSQIDIMIVARFDEPWQGNGWHERLLLACATSWGLSWGVTAGRRTH